MTEYLDVVDENDNVIGKASRKECHEKWLLHRIVHVFIFNSKGEFLLQKRSSKVDTNPNLLTSPAAGHVNQGQSYQNAAHMELKEELGVETDLEEIGKTIVPDPNHNQMVSLFSGVHDGPFKINKEIESLSFVNFEKLKKDIVESENKFTKAFLAVFKKFCEVKT